MKVKILKENVTDLGGKNILKKDATYTVDRILGKKLIDAGDATKISENVRNGIFSKKSKPVSKRDEVVNNKK